MGIVGIALFFIALIICIIYGIKLIIIAFQESTAWGLMYLFVPFANLYFVFTRWEKTKSPFLKTLIAIPLLIIGAMLMPMQSAVGY
ncbi:MULTISPECIES: hypothetical protein [Psychrobacter]|jgi:uncharacterized membrane protein|uniref:hypothetical protein n=1 Tax=Psychrobacter TaxID=497 RepID=UPI0004729F49|nr:MULTISPECIES: hypothetical protein [Psychrobacter]NRD70087.1 hypothetical protein [Psychrobacter okhotskensis]PKG36386.1 hypothetical protein CXF65_02765 [Psychrobacter sp. Sarcosine-3u-12]